jgi:phosphate-selective porin OprO/OprP
MEGKHVKHLIISSLCLILPLVPAGAQEARLQPGKGVSFKSEDGSATLNLGGRIQARYAYEDNGDSSTFSIPRLRLALKGTLYGSWNWEFQSDFAKHEKTSLKDGFIERSFGPALAVRGGQFKVAFDRQQLESSGRQTFVDRNIASGTLGKGRDAGVQAHGGFMNKMIQYQAGVFNGTGEGGTNTNAGHMVAGRLSLNPLGDFGLSQGDIKPSAKPLVFVDLAAYQDLDAGGTTDGTTGLALGAGAKWAGAYGAAEVFRRETSAGAVANGFYAQASYMLVPEFLEAAARYAQVDPNADAGGDLRTETTGGLNVYFDKAGHGLKLNADVSLLTDDAKTGDLKNNTRTRAQFQLVF